ARELYAEALRLRRKQREALSPNAAEVEIASADMDVADSINNVAYADLRLGDPKQAVANYPPAAAAPQAVAPPPPQVLRVNRLLAEIQVRLGDARSRLNELDAAEKHFQTALRAREDMVGLNPRPKQVAELVKTDVGQSRMYLGDFQLMVRKDRAAARKE